MALPVTVTDLVKWAEREEISYRNLHTNAEITNEKTGQKIIIPLNQTLSKYRYFIEPYLITASMNDVEMSIYCYRPKSLSKYLYGTTELWSLLLLVNNCISKIDFNKRTIKIPDPNTIKGFINEVLILEKVIK